MFRPRPPAWHGLIAIGLILTIPWWLLAVLEAIVIALGGNWLLITFLLFLALWVIAQL